MHTPESRSLLGEIAPAILSGILSLSGLVLLPVLDASDPAEGLVMATGAGWWATVALLVAQVVALLWSKRAPRAVLIGLSAAPVILVAVAASDAFSLTTIAVSIATFVAVVRRPIRALRVALPAALLLVTATQTLNNVALGLPLDLMTIGVSLAQALSVIIIPLVVGLFFAARNEARTSRANEIAALQRERDALIEAAIARERMAMSRELHDIAAHHMSGIALLASAISKQVDADPAAAKKSAEQVRAQSKSALDDLRRVIGLLRDEASRHVETLASITELVSARAKLSVHEGDHDLGTGIGPLAQLIAYRTVQEALANAAAHAPGSDVAVAIDDRGEQLIVEIVNTAAPDPGPGGGFGLVGMQERADLVDADLEYGPTADGGWRVALRVKRDE